MVDYQKDSESILSVRKKDDFVNFQPDFGKIKTPTKRKYILIALLFVGVSKRG